MPSANAVSVETGQHGIETHIALFCKKRDEGIVVPEKECYEANDGQIGPNGG
ncbi:MAG: hypothetical protein ACP6IU_08615 [Candidatus Asgardarchaeia archaeon]